MPDKPLTLGGEPVPNSGGWGGARNIESDYFATIFSISLL